MHPIHRLAQSSIPPSFFQTASNFVRNHPFWSSRLFIRVSALCIVFLFSLFWFAPTLHYGPSVSLDEGWHPPPGMPPLVDDDALRPPVLHPMQPDAPPVHEKLPTQVWDGRAQNVKDSFLFAWHGYEAAAFGYDELLPVSNGSTQSFNGWGVTIIDSLSTMLLMGLKDTEEYKRAMEHVAQMHFKDHNSIIPFFETVIRYLGGLLSAYALSKDPVLLTKATELGETLLPVFESPSGLPHFGYNPSTGGTAPSWAGHALLAEIASCQLEFKYLAHLTGREDFFLKVDKVIDYMEKSQRKDGLWSTHWNVKTGAQVGSHVSVGGLADSGYEYLLKGYLLSGKTEKRLLDMYLKSVDGVIEKMLYLSSKRDLLFLTILNARRVEYIFEHLACFYAGLLALGVEVLGSALTQEQADLHRWAAEGLTNTCYLIYAEAENGLGAEAVQMIYNVKQKPTRWMDVVRRWERKGRQGGVPPGVRGIPKVTSRRLRDYYWQNTGYYLRPETLESIYLMWKVTGDEVWRRRGWEIFESIEKIAKTKVGYGSVAGANTEKPLIQDSMPSYFMAETLKYLYLLFSSDDPIPLDKWVFNTEAHPLPVFQWKQSEKQAYKIRS